MIARREYFQLAKDDRVKYFRIYDPQCGKTYKIENLKDTVVFITKPTASTKPIPTVSNDRLLAYDDLAKWIATAVNDVEREFNKRVVYSIMDEQTDAIVLVRNGGKPEGEEDFEDMDK